MKIGTYGTLEALIPNPDLDFWNSDPKIQFWANMGWKSQSCLFHLEIGTNGISRMLILIPRLAFWIFPPKVYFWANLVQKSQSSSFYLKIGTHAISRMLILIPRLVFWISCPKSIFGQIWTKKVKVVHFAWKLAHTLSRGCWFLFQQWFSKFPNKNPFLGKFGPKKSKLSVLPTNAGTHGILRMLIVSVTRRSRDIKILLCPSAPIRKSLI